MAILSLLIRTPATPAQFIIIGCIIFAVFVYNYYFSRSAIVKRKLRNTGAKKMSEFRNGDVAKVAGTIKYAGKTLTAPLSGRKCVYYSILVEEKSGGKNSHWSTIIEEEVSADVVIADGNHYATINTRLVKSHLIPDSQYFSGFLNDPTEEMERYLARHNKDSTSLFGFNRSLRYSEGVLEQGEIVTVVGKGYWKKKALTKLSLPSENVLELGPDTDTSEPVYFTDDPGV